MSGAVKTAAMSPLVRELFERLLPLCRAEAVSQQSATDILRAVLDVNRMIETARTLRWQTDISVPANAVPNDLRPMTAEEFKKAHESLRSAVLSMYPPKGNRRRGATRLLVFDVQVTALGVRVRAGRRFELLVVSPRSIPWIVLQRIFWLYGDQLRRCQECDTLFIRTRRQTYCSESCSQRARSRRWYRAHTEEARGRRRESYVRERKRQNPNLLIGSRRKKPTKD